MEEISLKIDGMTCGGCRAAVERVLAATDGVERVAVDLQAGRAVVATSDGAAPLIAAVEGAGYEARLEQQ